MKHTLNGMHPGLIFAFDHWVWETGLPVRSADLEIYAGRLVYLFIPSSGSSTNIIKSHDPSKSCKIRDS